MPQLAQLYKRIPPAASKSFKFAPTKFTFVGSLSHQRERGRVNPGASSKASSGLTPRARARPAGTLDWRGRACPASAATATHHGRVPTHAVTRREGSGLRPRTGRGNRGEEERKRAWGLLPGAAHPGQQRIRVPLRDNSAGPKPGPGLGVPSGPSNPAKQAPTHTAQRAQPRTLRRAARTSQAVCPGPIVRCEVGE